MMRILMVIGRYRPKIGGTEIQAERLARALIQRGISVEILTGRERGLLSYESHDGLIVRRLWIPDIGLPILNALVLGIELYIAVLRRRAQFNVLHIHQGLYPAYFSILAAKHLGKPSIIKLSSSGRRLDLNQLKKQFFPFGQYAANFLSKNTDSFVALNTEIANTLMQDWQVPQSRVIRTPNGVELPQACINSPLRRKYRERLNLPIDIPLIVQVGSLREVKNPALAIQALNTLIKSGSKVKLILLGDGPLRPDLEHQVSHYGLNEHVAFMGQVTNVIEYLYAANVFLLPSLIEGLSNALLEAMAVGLPCITSDIPGNRQVIQHGVDGLLFESNSAEDLANTVSQVLNDPKFAAQLGHQARTKIEQEYSIDVVVEKYISLYDKLQDK
jgi:L-malate glycosyltransferase